MLQTGLHILSIFSPVSACIHWTFISLKISLENHPKSKKSQIYQKPSATPPKNPPKLYQKPSKTPPNITPKILQKSPKILSKKIPNPKNMVKNHVFFSIQYCIQIDSARFR